MPVPKIQKILAGEVNMLKVRLLVIVVLCINLSSCSNKIPANHEGVELYDWLSYEGLYDPSIDNKTVQQVLEEGLFSDEQDVVNAAIGTIGWYASRVSIERRQPLEDDPLVVRDVQTIEGLRKLLVDTWNQKYKQNPNYIAEMTDSDWLKVFEMRNERVITRLDKMWLGIPGTLAVLYPKDVEVHDLIWKAYDPKQDRQMLIRLEDGEFDTKRAMDYRIKVFLDEKSPSYVKAIAARGLGLFPSDEGLEALLPYVLDSEKSTDAIAHVIEAIVAHGDKAVEFADQLRSTAERYDLVRDFTMDRPTYYNGDHMTGRDYRVQIALRKLQELEELHPTLEP